MFNFKFLRKPGKTAYVNLDKITIKPDFLRTKIGEEKYKRKKQYFMLNGKYESTVYLNEDNVLLDGYSTYLIAKEYNLGKIPVVYTSGKKDKKGEWA